MDSLDAFLVVSINNPSVLITSRIGKNKYFTISVFYLQAPSPPLQRSEGFKASMACRKGMFSLLLFLCLFNHKKWSTCWFPEGQHSASWDGGAFWHHIWKKTSKGKKDLHLIRTKQNLIVNPSSPKAGVIQCASFYPLSPSHHGNLF